jgi:hypothetical protein
MSVTTIINEIRNVKLSEIYSVIKNPIITTRYMELKVNENGEVIVVRCVYEEQIPRAT